MSDTGKVYLVGAGPGDPGLITARANEALAECDVVVYDRLVPLELVVTLPNSVERRYVGKAADQHSLPQDQINQLLVDLAKEGKQVVRLKGGDPFVFGRGGEEALFLKQQKISFEVIPGVTAGIAASAYAGIPVTHRRKSVYTVLLTAHEAVDKDELQVPWEWLSQSESGTLVGYMGVKQLPEVVKRLLDGGMRPETPAALIERGTTAVQRQVTGTLENLPELAVKQNIKPPALFVIGPTVELVDQLIWREPGPLAGKRVMVTRPADQAVDMYRVLRRLGAEVLPLPTIATIDHMDECGWQELKKLDFYSGRPHWIVFTSENGVRYFVRQVYESGYDYRFLANFRFASMGAGTDRILREYHMKSDFIPSKYTSKVLAAEFSEHIKGEDAIAVRVRGNLGDDTIELALMKSGTKVIPLVAYQTFTSEWDAGMFALLEEQTPDIITFTSGSTATSLIEILGKERAVKLTENALVVSIGPMTTQIAEEEGLKVDIEAETHSVPGVVEALVKHFEGSEVE